MSKFRIWRGIAALLYVVFSVIISLSILAFHRSGDVNAFLYAINNDNEYSRKTLLKQKLINSIKKDF